LKIQCFILAAFKYILFFFCYNFCLGKAAGFLNPFYHVEAYNWLLKKPTLPTICPQKITTHQTRSHFKNYFISHKVFIFN